MAEFRIPDGGETFQCHVSFEKFPEWEKIIPSKKREEVSIGLNAELLKRLASILKLDTLTEHVELRVHLDTKTADEGRRATAAVIIVHHSNSPATTLLMPTRV